MKIKTIFYSYTITLKMQEKLTIVEKVPDY